MKKKTIYDVAKEAGVSISTVSRVINGSGYVSAETRKKVEQGCADFRPAASAREIQSKKSRTIGVIINHENDYFFMNESFVNVLRAIVTVAQKWGYRILLEHNKLNTDICGLYYEGRVDGILVLGCNEQDGLIEKLKNDQVPFVVIGTCKDEMVSQVEINNKKASYDVVNYLIGLGHRNIGIITGSLQYASGKDRLDGYKEALSDAGIPVREDLIEVCDDFSDKKAENLTKKLLYNPAKITALVTFNDIIAVASYRAAKEMKKKIGEELSIVGFDDDRVAAYITPALTTVWQPSYAKGERAAEILLSALEQGTLPKAREELACVLIFRDSCCEV